MPFNIDADAEAAEDAFGNPDIADTLSDTVTGADGVDWKTLLNFGAEAAGKGLDYYQAKGDAEAATKNDQASLDAANAADRAATAALATYLNAQAWAATSKSPADQAQADAAKMVSDQAQTAQDMAATGLSATLQAKRAAFAQKDAQAAAAASLAAARAAASAKGDVRQQAAASKAANTAKAAAATAMKAAAGQIASTPQDAAKAAAALEAYQRSLEPSLFSLRNLGIGAGVVGGTAGLVLGIRWLLKRRRK